MTRKAAKTDVPRGTQKVDENGQPVVERPAQRKDGDAPAAPIRRMG